MTLYRGGFAGSFGKMSDRIWPYLGSFLILAGLLRAETAKSGKEHWVVAANQANQSIECYDQRDSDWSHPGAVRWAFTPQTPDYTPAEVMAARLPSDARFRMTNHWDSTRVILMVTSGGLATIARFPDGKRLWSALVGGNPHAAELLPDGNIAVAASRGNWIRVYTSSQDSRSGHCVEFALEDAHAALWDPMLERLWVMGRIPGGEDVITALMIGGTPAKPSLTEDVARRHRLPSHGPHDLSPVYGDKNALWLTTVDHGYRFDKRTGEFSKLPGASDGKDIKALSNAPDGPLVQAKKKPGGCYDWTTDTVLFHHPVSGELLMAREVRGACFYKARAWGDRYQ